MDSVCPSDFSALVRILTPLARPLTPQNLIAMRRILTPLARSFTPHNLIAMRHNLDAFPDLYSQIVDSIAWLVICRVMFVYLAQSGAQDAVQQSRLGKRTNDRCGISSIKSDLGTFRRIWNDILPQKMNGDLPMFLVSCLRCHSHQNMVPAISYPQNILSISLFMLVH